MIGGGARAKAGKKFYRPALNEKKKLNCYLCEKKKTQQPGRKKNHHELYAGLRCPEHGHTCLLHTI